MATGTLKSRYDKLKTDRDVYLRRARDAAKLTIPSLIPDEGHNESTTYDTPWQSLGAKGVNNLASKLLLSLFQPNAPYFRLGVDEVDMEKLNAGTKGDIEDGLAAYERVVMKDVENSKTRSSLFLTFKHLLVSGNALILEDPESGDVRMYPMSRYVIKRTPAGQPYEIVTLDITSWGTLPADLKELVAAESGNKDEDTDVEIYTAITVVDGQWAVFQEINGVIVPGSDSTYPLEACPWIPLRWGAIDGEDYGRSFVEEIYGDLNTVDALQQAISEGSSIAALVKFLVNPNGQTEVNDLTETPNGGFCTGRKEDVSTLQVDKFGDLRVAREYLVELKADLSAAFLMHQSVQRNAERVTAEEIRFMAQELEDALGGIYSLLAQELQLPLVRSTIRRLTAAKKLPPLPKQVKTEIITGLPALGRNQEHQRLRIFVADLAQTFGPQVASEYITVDEYAKRSGAAMNLNTKGLVRTTDEVDQRRQAQVEQQAQAQAQATAASQPQQ